MLRVVASPVPVIVVGNLSVGGTGKTPVVIWLAQTLRARGYTPGIVSRGYGGSGQLSAVQPTSSPELVGDEPVLIAARTQCPVWVGRDRSAAVQRLLTGNPQVDVIISDDGLQHYRLARDCEIVVIDAGRQFGNRLMLPAGPLREPPSRLDSVDAIVSNGTDHGEHTDHAFSMRLQGDAFVNLLDPAKRQSHETFRNMRLHAVAGIGNPERFFTHVRNLGLSFTAHAFTDHHAFTVSDLDFRDADAVLMTEKDAIKCSRFARRKWWSLPVDAHIDSALADLVIKKIGSSRGH